MWRQASREGAGQKQQSRQRHLRPGQVLKTAQELRRRKKAWLTKRMPSFFHQGVFLKQKKTQVKNQGCVSRPCVCVCAGVCTGLINTKRACFSPQIPSCEWECRKKNKNLVKCNDANRFACACTCSVQLHPYLFRDNSKRTICIYKRRRQKFFFEDEYLRTYDSI